MAQAQIERKNPSQDKSRACSNMKKVTTNLVEVAKTPALVFFHNPTTKKLEVWGDKFSVEAAKNHPDLLDKADTILSHSVASGQDFSFTDLKDLETSEKENPSLTCPLPKLQFKMFSEYKKFKENAHLRSSYAKMWRSLQFGTKELRYGVAGCKPDWFDEKTFVPWSTFKGSARPEGFSGNWAFLQYDIMKACYLHYMTVEEIEEYLVKCRLPEEESIETPGSASIPVDGMFSVPVVMANGERFVEVGEVDDVFESVDDPTKTPEDSLEDMIAKDTNENNEDDQTVTEPRTPVMETEVEDEETRTPEKEPKTPEAIHTVPNTPGSLNMKRSFSKAFVHEELKKKMTKGWLADVVKDPTLAAMGYIQVLGLKRIAIKGEMKTLIKVSDGQYVTWNVVIDEEKEDDILRVNTRSVIEVTKASVEQGFRIIIHNFEIIDDEVSEEITLADELVFLEKSWYLQMFTKKGMVDKKGSRNLKHPHYQTTPLRMMTRSKKARLGSGGIPCVSCEKIFKSDKTMEQHRKKYH